MQHEVVDESTLNMGKIHSPRYSLQVRGICNLCIKTYTGGFSSFPAKINAEYPFLLLLLHQKG